MIALRSITRTITVREGRRHGKLKRVSHLLEWRNWQTHGTQNPAPFTGHVGSTPTSSTIIANGLLLSRCHFLRCPSEAVRHEILQSGRCASRFPGFCGSS